MGHLLARIWDRAFGPLTWIDYTRPGPDPVKLADRRRP